MHPEIRAWPSRKFYDGRLEDSKSVTDRELAYNQTPYQVSSQRFPLGAPYKVFDVVGGSSLKNQHGSLSNPEEALFVVCLYSAMVRAVEEERKKRSTAGGNTKSTFGTHDGQITLNPKPQNLNPKAVGTVTTGNGSSTGTASSVGTASDTFSTVTRTVSNTPPSFRNTLPVAKRVTRACVLAFLASTAFAVADSVGVEPLLLCVVAVSISHLSHSTD